MKTKMYFSLLLAASLILAAWGSSALSATLLVPAGYPTIQDAINAASPGDTIEVAAFFVNPPQDLQIYTDGLYLKGRVCNTVIEGLAVSGGPFPLAVPNIDIQANDVRISRFTIRSPAPTAIGEYASGIVLTGKNIQIDHNCFEVATGEGSQGIQTWAGTNAPVGLRDISGLKISYNKFTHLAPATAFGNADAYEGIFINGQSDPTDPLNPVVIDHNDFKGEVWRGIAVERSDTKISYNTLKTDYAGPIASTSRGIELRPDFLSGDTFNHIVDHNTVSDGGTSAFHWGIRSRAAVSGYPAGEVQDFSVLYNIVSGGGCADPGSICIEIQGSVPPSTFINLTSNYLRDCYDGIYVEDGAVVKRNAISRSCNDGLSVGNSNNLEKNTIGLSGVADLHLRGAGNIGLPDANIFTTCTSDGGADPCP